MSNSSAPEEVLPFPPQDGVPQQDWKLQMIFFTVLLGFELTWRESCLLSCWKCWALLCKGPSGNRIWSSTPPLCWSCMCVHGQLWKYSQAHNSVHASTQCVWVHCQLWIYSQGHPPVTLEERDQVKLGEGLVQRCSPLVGNHEKRVVAPRASNAYKLSKSVQEVVRTCGVGLKFPSF